ncbi:MAG: ankyrin repeat domain-containing protein, partial [Crocinitomicaceae bacterium]|nr:ankyrin repeat domain-containing protein [Crocinitomicaceae bacterium]
VKAAWKGELETVKALVESGVSVNDVDRYGLSALHAAAQNSNYEQFSFLLENGADPNYVYGCTHETPIFWVNWNLNDRGKLNFYQLLIDKGANLQTVNYKGKTIYQILKEQVYLKDDAKFLKSKGAK